ncbi:MAG TPA: cupin domain-containing protein [Candidatus Limnocylindria bacterium]|nr:cupin domain-containing protein [Candidatus Limnocylindria bacterium]
MRLTRGNDTATQEMDRSHFTGRVTARDLGSYGAPDGSVLLVSFPAGVRTHWHSHPGGQFLYITEGSGRVGTRDGEVVHVGIGDLVHAPPGEEHWHGGAEEAGVTHLAVSLGATEWKEAGEI